MCGRFSLFADDEQLVSLFDVDLLEGEHDQSWNVAPSHQVRVVLDRMVPEPAASSASHMASADATTISMETRQHLHGAPGGQPPSGTRVRQRQMRLVEWGLVPSWAKPPFRPMINARAETLVEKPSFRSAASKRRCLVPANGYFEWQQAASGPKQPWFLSAGAGDPVLAFAGVIEMRKDLQGQWWPTCAIVTSSAPDALGQIHERTPVIVPPDMWDAWLDPALVEADDIRGLLQYIPAPALVPRQVSRAVGSVKNNGPDLIRAIS